MSKVVIESGGAGTSPTTQAQNMGKPIVYDDPRGRRITLEEPGVLMQYRIVELVGQESAKNEVYMGMIMPLTFISKIEQDGEVEDVTIHDKLELEGLITRLGKDGINALMDNFQKNFIASNPEDDKKKLKK